MLRKNFVSKHSFPHFFTKGLQVKDFLIVNKFPAFKISGIVKQS